MPLASHADRIAARAASNGQPNGYKPISESELQALHCAALAKSLPRLNSAQPSSFRFHLKLAA